MSPFKCFRFLMAPLLLTLVPGTLSLPTSTNILNSTTSHPGEPDQAQANSSLDRTVLIICIVLLVIPICIGSCCCLICCVGMYVFKSSAKELRRKYRELKANPKQITQMVNRLIQQPVQRAVTSSLGLDSSSGPNSRRATSDRPRIDPTGGG